MVQTIRSTSHDRKLRYFVNVICPLDRSINIKYKTKQIARMAELADALDLGSSAFGVGVRLPLLAPLLPVTPGLTHFKRVYLYKENNFS